MQINFYSSTVTDTRRCYQVQKKNSQASAESQSTSTSLLFHVECSLRDIIF